MTEHELRYRQRLIDAIEGEAGTLQSVPYNEITTGDLEQLLMAINNIRARKIMLHRKLA